MNYLLEKILNTKEIEVEDGNIISLDSSIDLDEVLFIQKLILDNKIENSIEIGCAMGISSLAICESIKING